MKNKGFTLIELLAVIVVLAVVALIAFPIIAGIIEKTKRSAAYRSVEGYVEAANNAAVLYDLDNNKGINVTEAKHTFTSNVDTEDFSKIKAKGTLPTYSYLDFDINKKVVTEGHFCINGYSVLYSNGTAKASETKYCEDDNQGGNGSGNNDNLPNENTNSQDNGACTDEKILSTANIRYNPETKYIQVLSGATWVNAMYFDTEWDGTVYAFGTYSKEYFDVFSGASYTFQEKQLLTGWNGGPSSWANGSTGSSMVFKADKFGTQIQPNQKLHILYDVRIYGGAGSDYEWIKPGHNINVITSVAADGIATQNTTIASFGFDNPAKVAYGTLLTSVNDKQADVTLNDFVGKNISLSFTVSKTNRGDFSPNETFQFIIKKIWIS